MSLGMCAGQGREGQEMIRFYHGSEARILAAAAPTPLFLLSLLLVQTILDEAGVGGKRFYLIKYKVGGSYP